MLFLNAVEIYAFTGNLLNFELPPSGLPTNGYLNCNEYIY